MVASAWYVRDRCPNFAYLSPQSQPDWMILLHAEFFSTRALNAGDLVNTWQSQGIQIGSETPILHNVERTGKQPAASSNTSSLRSGLEEPPLKEGANWRLEQGQEVRGQNEIDLGNTPSDQHMPTENHPITMSNRLNMHAGPDALFTQIAPPPLPEQQADIEGGWGKTNHHGEK